MISTDSGRATQLTRSPWHEVHPSFSPDGRQLVYCMFNARAEQWELWVLQLDRPDARRMIGVGLFPRWSPKGDSILYQRARERGGRWFSIWRIDLENGEPRFPVELAASSQMALIQPTWSPDGEWVAYGTALPQTGRSRRRRRGDAADFPGRYLGHAGRRDGHAAIDRRRGGPLRTLLGGRTAGCISPACRAGPRTSGRCAGPRVLATESPGGVGR